MVCRADRGRIVAGTAQTPALCRQDYGTNDLFTCVRSSGNCVCSVRPTKTHLRLSRPDRGRIAAGTAQTPALCRQCYATNDHVACVRSSGNCVYLVQPTKTHLRISRLDRGCIVAGTAQTAPLCRQDYGTNDHVTCVRSSGDWVCLVRPTKTHLRLSRQDRGRIAAGTAQTPPLCRQCYATNDHVACVRSSGNWFARSGLRKLICESTELGSVGYRCLFSDGGIAGFSDPCFTTTCLTSELKVDVIVTARPS